MSDQASNIQFVQEVEKYPCLYNYELTQYSRKDITDEAWNNVGKIMNMSGAACKEKWKNLRAVFVRHMKAGPSGPGFRKRKYYLTDVMQFVLPYIKSISTTQSGNIPENDNLQDTKEDYMTESSDAVNSSFAQYDFEASTSSQARGNQSKRYMDEEDRSYINSCEESIMRHKSDDDLRKMFLLSLLDEVNQMTDEQMRKFKRKVLALIDEIMVPTSP